MLLFFLFSVFVFSSVQGTSLGIRKHGQSKQLTVGITYGYVRPTNWILADGSTRWNAVLRGPMKQGEQHMIAVDDQYLCFNGIYFTLEPVTSLPWSNNCRYLLTNGASPDGEAIVAGSTFFMLWNNNTCLEYHGDSLDLWPGKCTVDGIQEAV